MSDKGMNIPTSAVHASGSTGEQIVREIPSTGVYCFRRKITPMEDGS
jgi:hypothetical protein